MRPSVQQKLVFFLPLGIGNTGLSVVFAVSFKHDAHSSSSLSHTVGENHAFGGRRRGRRHLRGSFAKSKSSIGGKRSCFSSTSTTSHGRRAQVHTYTPSLLLLKLRKNTQCLEESNEHTRYSSIVRKSLYKRMPSGSL